MNAKFTSKHSFVHCFENGVRVLLKVDSTQKETRFSFRWYPGFKSLDELREIVPEFEKFRDYWSGLKDSFALHSLADLMFYRSCDLEVEKLEEVLS